MGPHDSAPPWNVCRRDVGRLGAQEVKSRDLFLFSFQGPMPGSLLEAMYSRWRGKSPAVESALGGKSPGTPVFDLTWVRHTTKQNPPT